MAVETGRAVRLYRVRWVCGAKEGCCWIRGSSADDVAQAFHAEPWRYGAQHDTALVVYAIRESILHSAGRAPIHD